MTAHVTQAKIEAAVRAAVAAGWTGGVEIDLRTGVVRLRHDIVWRGTDTRALEVRPFRRRTPHPKGPPLPRACYRINERYATRFPIDPEVQSAVWERDGERCRYCGCERGPFSIDHIHPVARGGDNVLENLAVACSRCNSSKHAKLLFEQWDPPCCLPHIHAKPSPDGGTVHRRLCDKCSIVATCEASVSGA